MNPSSAQLPIESGGGDAVSARTLDTMQLDAESLREVLDGWLDAVVVVDSQSLTIVYSNRACELLLGYATEELVSSPFGDLFAEADPDETSDGDASQQAFDQVLGGQRFRRKDGSSLPVDVIARMAQLGEESTSYVVIGLRDATERLRAEAERERLLEELREALDTVKLLEGLLPICCVCKQIRDDEGDWSDVEEYITEHTKVHFSHGLCPHCFEKMKAQI